jgi:site-specific DNA-cytosine methylase
MYFVEADCERTERKDLLTVRELARFQGFEDSFVFYHSIAHQHWDVINATPPIVARHVANAIFRVIQGFRAVRLDDPRVGQRVNKRARVEESTEV